MAAPHPDARPVGEIIDKVKTMQGRPQVSLGELLQEFGPASFVPALMVPALIVVSPLSGIFFLPTVCGLTIALIASQLLIGRTHLWLPAILTRRSLPGHRMASMFTRLDRWGGWVDRHTHPRLGLLQRWPLRLLAPIACIVAGLMMPFLELVPLSSSILGAAIVCFSVSILSRDGVYLMAGLGFLALGAMVPAFVLYRF